MRSRTAPAPNPEPSQPAPAAAPADAPKPGGRRRLGGAPSTPADPSLLDGKAKPGEPPPGAPSTPTGDNPAPLPEPQTKGNAVFDDHVQDVEDRRAAGRSARAADAPKTAAGLNMGHHQRIVDVLFDMPDPMEVYSRVRRALSFGGRASSMGYGALVDALDEAETNAADAFQLLCDAKVTHDRFELDAQVISGALRDKATSDLQAQKNAGERSKAITNDDITAVMAAKFHDEYRDLETRRSRAKRTVAALESLADLSRERARDLRAMVGKARDA